MHDRPPIAAFVFSLERTNARPARFHSPLSTLTKIVSRIILRDLSRGRFRAFRPGDRMLVLPLHFGEIFADKELLLT